MNKNWRSFSWNLGYFFLGFEPNKLPGKSFRLNAKNVLLIFPAVLRFSRTSPPPYSGGGSLIPILIALLLLISPVFGIHS